MFWLSLHSWNMFLLFVRFDADNSLSALKNVSLPTSLSGFWWKIYCHMNSFSLWYVIFSQFQNIVLYFVFLKFIINFFGIFLFGDWVVHTFESVNLCISWNLGKFVISLYTFYIYTIFLFLSRLVMIGMLAIWYSPTFSSVHYFSFFFLSVIHIVQCILCTLHIFIFFLFYTINLLFYFIFLL